MPMLAQIAAALLNAPLLCQHHYAEVVATVLAPRLGVAPMLAQTDFSMMQRPARLPALMDNGVMILPIVGGLVHRGQMFDAMSGSASYTTIQNTLANALSDRDVKAILLDVDSPGGQVGGLVELAELIMAAREEKPIWAIANTAAYSAAYALGCAASKFFASPSAGVGSIGVVWMHVDMSKALERAGIVTSFVYRGARKLDGNPTQPLSKDARAEMEARAEEAYALFTGFVSRARGIPEQEIRDTEAACYGAQEATERKLVDGVQPLGAVIAALEAEAKQLSSKPKGTVVMTTANAPAAPVNAAVPAAPPVDLIGKSESDKLVAAAYAGGRADAGKILALDSAKDRPALAAQLVGDADIKPEKADALLKSAGTETKASKLAGIMEKLDPSVGAGGGAESDDDKRKAELQGAAKLASRSRWGGKA